MENKTLPNFTTWDPEVQIPAGGDFSGMPGTLHRCGSVPAPCARAGGVPLGLRRWKSSSRHQTNPTPAPTGPGGAAWQSLPRSSRDVPGSWQNWFSHGQLGSRPCSLSILLILPACCRDGDGQKSHPGVHPQHGPRRVPWYRGMMHPTAGRARGWWPPVLQGALASRDEVSHGWQVALATSAISPLSMDYQ